MVRSHLNWIIGWAQTAGSETLLANARRALEALPEQGKGGLIEAFVELARKHCDAAEEWEAEIRALAPAQPAEHRSDAITRARKEGATEMRERCALALEHPALSGDLPFPEAADVVREVPLPEEHPAPMVTCSTDTEEHHGPHRLRHPTRDEKSWCLDPVPAEHPAGGVIQPAVGPAQDGAGADLPRSGIPPIDHDFQANTWPKRDECDKRVSDDGRNSRQCGRPRREHQNHEGGK